MTWRRDDLPPKVYALLISGGVLVGSQARRYADRQPPGVCSDWDIMIPHVHWPTAAMHIPKSARPNGYRGWRFDAKWEDRLVSVDVWPDDLRRCMRTAAKHVGKEVSALAYNDQLLISAQLVEVL